MENAPTFVNISDRTWTLVADAIQSGTIHIKTPGRYMHTWRKDGQAAPTSTDETLGVLFEGNSAVIAADEDIDVYVMFLGGVNEDTGRVMVSY